jgi:spore maturation protein B
VNFKFVLDWLAIIVIPVILLIFIGMAEFKKVKVYEKFVEGAKEGFEIGVKIIPYLVAMLVAIGMFRASGALDILTIILKPITNLIGMPSEVLPMALMRPLSGSGSIGVMTELMKTHGVDSLIGFMSSTMYGSTETTFYVIAVYFGAVNIQRTRYALPAGLMADAAGLIAAALICSAIF